MSSSSVFLFGVQCVCVCGVCGWPVPSCVSRHARTPRRGGVGWGGVHSWMCSRGMGEGGWMRVNGRTVLCGSLCVRVYTCVGASPLCAGLCDW